MSPIAVWAVLIVAGYLIAIPVRSTYRKLAKID